MKLRKTSEIVKEILKINNYDEVSYAEKLGKSRQSVGYVIKDQRAPSKDFLESLYKNFDVPIETQGLIELYEDWRKTPDRIKIMFLSKEEESEKFKKLFFRLSKMIGLYKCFMKTAADIFGETIISKDEVEELKKLGIDLEN